MNHIKEKPYLIFFGLFFILTLLPHVFLIERQATIAMGLFSLLFLAIGIRMRHKTHPVALPKNQRLTVIGLQIILTLILFLILFWLMT